MCTHAIYYMEYHYVHCYESYADDEVNQQLWLCSEWMGVVPGGIRFYIREDRLSLALIINPSMRRIRREDWIV
jgi:hypothetical protein